MIEGRQLLSIVPEFSQAPRRVTRRNYRLVGLSNAPRIANYPGKIAFHVLNFQFLFTSKAAQEAFSEFFDSMAGTFGDFFIPSWHAELNPLQDLAIGQTTLQITPVDYNLTYLTETDPTRLGHYVWFYAIDGTTHISKVTSCADGTPEVLTLATAPAAKFTLGQYIMGFVYLVRFANDVLILTFNGPNEATSPVSLIEVMQTTATADA